jgi:subtilisin family serine protease
MKKVSYALALALVALSANAQSKLDAGSRMALDYFKRAQAGQQNLLKPSSVPFELNTMTRGESTTSMFVSLKPGADLAKIEALDFEVVSLNGNIAIVSGSLNNVEQLAALDEVVSISFGSVAKPKLDKARAAINADEVQEGADVLPQSYNGTGVITGIFDTGLDPNHPNFQDADGNSRVKGIWRYAGTNGQTVKYDVADFTTDTRSETHGTHTLGCMAGSFNKKGGKVATISDKGAVSVRATIKNPYYGIATGSDIVIGCGELTNANIIAGAGELMDYAAAEGKPIVINMSIGSNYGPHDGTDLYSQSLTELTKKGVICVAAGNEGQSNISVRKTFTTSDKQLKTFFVLGSSSSSGLIDVWASNSEDFVFTPAIYNTTTGEVVECMDISTSKEQTAYLTCSTYTDASYTHNSSFDAAFSSSYIIFQTSQNASTNNRREVQLSYNLTYNSSTNKNKTYLLGFIITGKPSQTIDMVTNDDYAEFSGNSVAGWTDGTPDLSISTESCAKGIISVGSFNSRTSWGTIGKYVYGYTAAGFEQDGISGFSSYATLNDGTTLPTVLGPGAGVISSISSYYTDTNYSSDDLNTCSALYTQNGRDYYWENEQGTSMACPVVSGTVALWLQANPNLTSEEIVNIMKQTSVQDEATLADPVKAGAGKINALAGIKYILGLNSVNSIAVDSADKMLVTSAGQNEWQVYVPGASAVKAALYSTSGQLVANVSANSDTAVINGNKLAKGIYILSANGKSQRVIVK